MALKRVRIERGNRCGLGTETYTEYKITVNGVYVGSAHEKGGIYTYKNERYTRKRLEGLFR